MACLLSRPAVHEVGRWFIVLPGKGLCGFAYGTRWLQLSHRCSRVVLSWGCVGSPKNTFGLLFPCCSPRPQVSARPAQLIWFLSAFILGAVTSATGLEEAEDQEGTAMDRLMQGG